MENPKNILLATDLCDACDGAAKYALTLAMQTDGVVHIVHGTYLAGNPDNLPPSADLTDDEFEVRLSAWLGRHSGPSDAAFSQVVRSDSPSLAITEYAVAHDIDLIVVGMERAGLLGMLQGDRTAKAIIRGAPCPVTVVGPGYTD